MQLYFSPLACSMASKIVAEEAGAALEAIEIDPQAKTVLATGEDYYAINPLGLVPALRTPEGIFLTENAAVLPFIADEFPEAGLAPPPSDRVGRAKLQQWLSFIGTELHKAVFIALLDRKAPQDAKDYALKKAPERFAYLDAHLAGRAFLLDSFSVADAYLATVLNWTQAVPQLDLSAYANVQDYLARMRMRPSVAKVLGIEVPLFQAEMARRKAA